MDTIAIVHGDGTEVNEELVRVSGVSVCIVCLNAVQRSAGVNGEQRVEHEDVSSLPSWSSRAAATGWRQRTSDAGRSRDPAWT